MLEYNYICVRSWSTDDSRNNGSEENAAVCQRPTLFSDPLLTTNSRNFAQKAVIVPYYGPLLWKAPPVFLSCWLQIGEEASMFTQEIKEGVFYGK